MTKSNNSNCILHIFEMPKYSVVLCEWGILFTTKINEFWKNKNQILLVSRLPIIVVEQHYHISPKK